VVVDAINSTGALSVPPLLERLGCTVTVLNDDLSGQFAHNPEPLPKHLTDLSAAVVNHQADLGIAVDPDVDRLAFVCEDGTPFGEEYTLVAVADYVLQHQAGPTVSNLSSSRALRDVTQKYGQNYFASAVGEVNVVAQMKAVDAVIGGEGNGGVIFPKLHYGRDALVGIGLFLSHLARVGLKASKLKASYPAYSIRKNKIDLSPELDLDQIFIHLKKAYPTAEINETDGLKLDLENGWIHLRKSNTEPIIRVYTESENEEAAQELAEQVMAKIKEI
jgi:phosphomannomutase